MCQCISWPHVFTEATSNIDLEHVFSFPLTPVPLTMCNSDGTMAHADKSKLFKLLEGTVSDHGSPTFVGTHIIDGNFQFQCMLLDQPAVYGVLSQNILVTSLVNKSRRIDINFDMLIHMKDHPSRIVSESAEMLL